MIELRRLGLRDRLLEAVFPELRRIRVEQIDKAMRILMRDPGEPCVIDDMLIPDGYGTPPRRIK